MPYAIQKANDPNLRKQITNALNMATVQTLIGLSDALTVPEYNQAVVWGDLTINGELKIAGELVVTTL